MLNKEIPFLRIGLPLCAGIISGLYIQPVTLFLVLTVIAIIAGFIISLLFNKSQTNLVFGFTITISFFICGSLLYAREKSSLSTLKPEQSLFSCILTDYPDQKENSKVLSVKLKNKITDCGVESVKGSLILYFSNRDSPDEILRPGDLMLIKCKPTEINNKGNPHEFDYRFYMENRGIKYYSFVNSQDIISHAAPDHRRLKYSALIIRNKIIDLYKSSGIKGEKLAVVAAITLGQKNMLDPEQKQNFIKAGVIHIMAVSGLHAVILSLFVFNLLFFLKRRFNPLRIIITILFLWSFAFITGLTPSVMRATLMFSFLQAGKLMRRRVNSINSVLASAFILILIKPSSIFDAGFLLSYSAVIYIISFYQDLYHKIQFKHWLTDKIWQSAVVTIVAQAGTLPLTIMLFNRFPTYFILTNIIIIPLSSLLIVLGCLIPLTYPVHFLSHILASILNHLTEIILLLTKKISLLPWSSLENIGMKTPECIILISTIFVVSNYMLKKKSMSPVYPLMFIYLFFLTDTLTEISTRRTNELIVYNTPGYSTIGIRTGKILYLYSDSVATGPEVERECATLGLKTKTYSLKDELYCIRAGERNILISKSLNRNIILHYQPDIVILTGLYPEIENNLTKEIFPHELIITTGYISGSLNQYAGTINNPDTLHLVRKSGAYTRQL